MGLCGSKVTEEEKASRALQASHEAEVTAEKRKIKLLLLGAGESGKSTIFKQMKILYGVGFNQEDLKAAVPVIYSNVISSMQSLIKATQDFGIEDGVSAKTKDDMAFVMGLNPDEDTVEGKTGECIRDLWREPAIQAAYDMRSKFQLNDSAAYYFDKITAISAPGYVANMDDLLKSRVRTSGIVEEAYKIGGVDFVMYDVGGQRNERKKWIHCFDDVTAVIFVASLSEYDQVLYEDNTVNRMEEAVTLFSDIANSRWFKSTAMILFLNKRDLFAQKIRRSDIRNDGSDGAAPRFLDYTGGTCRCPPEKGENCECGAQEAAKTYILNLFKSKYTEPGKEIYHHITCATDTNNVSTVFNACKEIILKENIKGSGFMG